MFRLLTVAVAAAVACGVTASPISHEEVPHVNFAAYTKRLNKQYAADEYATRQALFEATKAEVLAHNADMTASYKLTLNQMSDWTTTEMRTRLGGINSAAVPGRPQPTHPFDLKMVPVEDLPKSVDWRDHGIITSVKDQGMCGSCYAFATTETIESYAGLSNPYMSPPVLSPEQIVECAPNPKDCGGVGGCGGSIPEVVYAWIKEVGGQTQEFIYGYESYWGLPPSCRFNNTNTRGGTPAIVTLDGFVKLPPNNYTAVMNALAQVGPLAINVAAEPWKSYSSGIFSCSTSGAGVGIDHVVQLVGYGEDSNGLYWTVRNSWNPTFGEGGYIRLARTTPGETPVCGIDTDPAAGTGCTGGPKQVEVCGPCGLLYDVSYPVGVKWVSQ